MTELVVCAISDGDHLIAEDVMVCIDQGSPGDSHTWSGVFSLPRSTDIGTGRRYLLYAEGDRSGEIMISAVTRSTISRLNVVRFYGLGRLD